MHEAAAAAPADFRRRAFTLDYDESVRVEVSAGRRFELTVTDTDGNVLERRRNLSVRRLLLLRSEHFTARAIEPPSSSTPVRSRQLEELPLIR